MKNKESSDAEIKALKVQLGMAEEARDGARRDLIEAHRKIREAEESKESLRKENLSFRRQVKDEELEKSALEKAVENLREKVKFRVLIWSC